MDETKDEALIAEGDDVLALVAEGEFVTRLGVIDLINRIDNWADADSPDDLHDMRDRLAKLLDT